MGEGAFAAVAEATMGTTTWCSFLGDSSFTRVIAALGVRSAPTIAAAFGAGPLLSAVAPRGLAGWLEARTGRRRVESAPDLGTLLDDRGFFGAARDDLRRFEDLVAPTPGRPWPFFVGRCAADDHGSFAVAVYRADGPSTAVRPGDTFFGGVQLSGHVGVGVVLAEPHVLRRVCVNGATAHVAADVGVYARWNASECEGDLESVVSLGFSGRLLSEVTADLRRAAMTPLPRLSDLRARGLLKVGDDVAASILSNLRAEEPTLYGLYNAMTRVARDTTDVRAAVSLERTAGRLVARLVRAPENDPVAAGAPVSV